MRERFVDACYQIYYSRSLELIRVAKTGSLEQMANLLRNNICGFTFLPHQPKQQAFIEAVRRGGDVGSAIADAIHQDLYRRNVLVLSGNYTSFCNPVVTYIVPRQEQFKRGDLKTAFTYAVKARNVSAIRDMIINKVGITSEDWSNLFDSVAKNIGPKPELGGVVGDRAMHVLDLENHQNLIDTLTALIAKAPTGELEKYKELKKSQLGDIVHRASDVLAAIAKIEGDLASQLYNERMRNQSDALRATLSRHRAADGLPGLVAAAGGWFAGLFSGWFNSPGVVAPVESKERLIELKESGKRLPQSASSTALLVAAVPATSVWVDVSIDSSVPAPARGKWVASLDGYARIDDKAAPAPAPSGTWAAMANSFTKAYETGMEK